MMKSMKWIMTVAVTAFSLSAPIVRAQKTNTPPAKTLAAAGSSPDSQETNIRAYIELLRSDIKAQKTAILADLMQLNDEQAEKFWPIYRDYDYELQGLNDKKLAGIQDYAKNYQGMTDAKADELAKLALALENQRNAIKAKYYEKFREQLGGILAARFLQIENQMLMIIDLQISSSLPIMEK